MADVTQYVGIDTVSGQYRFFSYNFGQEGEYSLTSSPPTQAQYSEYQTNSGDTTSYANFLNPPVTPEAADAAAEADPTATVKTPSATTTYDRALENQGVDEIDAAAQTGASASSDTAPTNSWQEEVARTRSDALPKGAQPPKPVAAQAQWSEAKDLRVKLRVPNEYLVGPAAGPSNIIQKNGGILFPYTPAITVENQASYASQTPLHSNYPLYFYKNSSIQPINVTAKFTVQNEFEGAVLLGVIHLLRALTKMKFGNDPDAGSPPPVCRFDAYGDYMLYNVPVSIASWRHELPDNVDYIAVGRPGSPTTYGHSMVPVISTIQLTLNVMYSRREMLAHNVKDWLGGGLRYKGYL